MRAIEDFICTADPVGVVGCAVALYLTAVMVLLGWGAEQ